MEEIDIWRAAHQMIDLHAEKAVVEAAKRQVALDLSGDAQGVVVWGRIILAIDSLMRDKPPAGGSQQ